MRPRPSLPARHRDQSRRRRHRRRRGAAHRAGPRHSRPVVGRVPVAELNRLIETALRANPDIQAAAAATEDRARERPRPARHALPDHPGRPRRVAEPDAASLSCSRPPTNQTTSTACSRVGLTLTYNLDLWGANRRQIESLDALAEAQCFQLEGAYLSLASNVVAAAILEASLRAQIEATRAHHRRPARHARHPATASPAWAR